MAGRSDRALNRKVTPLHNILFVKLNASCVGQHYSILKLRLSAICHIKKDTVFCLGFREYWPGGSSSSSYSEDSSSSSGTIGCRSKNTSWSHIAELQPINAIQTSPGGASKSSVISKKLYTELAVFLVISKRITLFVRSYFILLTRNFFLQFFWAFGKIFVFNFNCCTEILMYQAHCLPWSSSLSAMVAPANSDVLGGSSVGS